jgi:hypothetical protein
MYISLSSESPTFQFAMKGILRDGEAFNITCMLDGGRPNPNVYFNISGSEISSAKTHFYNSTSSLHTNIITLTSFKKEWNKENITCCRYNEWYKISRKCSPPKQVKYLCKFFLNFYFTYSVYITRLRLSCYAVKYMHAYFFLFHMTIYCTIV